MKANSLLFTLLACCSFLSLRAQELTRPALVLKTKERPARIASSPDGHLLAVSDETKTGVGLWDTRTGELKASVQGSNEPSDPTATWLSLPSESKFSPDGRFLAILAYRANEVRLLNVGTGKLEATLRGLSDLCHIAFSPDGRILALSSFTRGLRLLDISAGQLVEPKWDTGGAKGVNAVEFSADGKTVILWVAGRQGADYQNIGILLIETATGKVKTAITPSKARALVGVASSDGRALITYEGEGEVKLWDVESGRQKATVNIDRKGDYKLTFSLDGGTIAAVGKGKSISLWDSATGKQKAVLAGEDDKDVTFQFSPDGKLLATASKRGVKLWDVTTGELKQSISDARDPVGFTNDGKTFAAAAKDRAVMLWKL